MKTRISYKILSLMLCFVMLVSVIPLTVFAAETTPEWIADYTVTASCGAENTTLGSFNGSSACVNATTGDLHYCTANFPYSKMASALYYSFTNNASASYDKKIADLNTDIFMNLDTALKVTGIDVNSAVDQNEKSVTLQGIQYFTNLKLLDFSGSNIYDGRYDGEYTLQSIDLSKNTKLEELHLEYTSLASIELSANTAIKELYLVHSSSTASSRENKYKGLTRFETLDLSTLVNLEELYIYDQDLQALDLSKNAKLKRINLALLSKLETLDFSKNEALEYARVFRAGVSDVKFGNNPNLTEIDMTVNYNLKSIAFSGCTALTDVDVSSNALETVDFSDCTALKYLYINSNALKTLDVSKNTNLYKLECKSNQLTSLDLSNNAKIGSVSASDQRYTVDSITDDVLDLHTLTGVDISKIQKQDDGNGGTYQFNVKKSDSYSATNNYSNVGEDLLLSVDGDNYFVFYSYNVATYSNGNQAYMSVRLEILKKYYTVKSATTGITLKKFDYSNGAGDNISNTTVKRNGSLQFVVEVAPDSPLYGKKLAVFALTEGGEKKAADEYTYSGTIYYYVGGIKVPTSIIVEEGHDCIFSEWAPMEDNSSKHERHCTVAGCTESETGYCSNYYGTEYHADKDTMQKDCTVCGRQYTWEIDVSASVHVPAADAQCDAPGNIEFWICGHCDKYFLDENCQNEVTPAQVYIDPLEHNYVNNICTECGYEITSARFEESLEDVFASDDRYLYVFIGVGNDGKLYAMGEAADDSRRYGVEIPDAQIDENGVITLNSNQAEFMNFEYYFEDGATATTTHTFIVDGNYMTVRNGKIYTFPKDRLDDESNPRPIDFRQAEYGDESGLGYVYGDYYEPENGHRHTNEYITFNPETHYFEASDTRQNTIYLYRRICEHESIYLSHTYPVEPTCTEQGYSGDYWFCSMCQTYFTDESCTTELEIPEYVSFNEYFELPALGHNFASNGVCENCGMKRNIYKPVTMLEQFDELSEDAYYIIVFKDGDKTYAAYIPNMNNFNQMVTADSDGDGVIDLLETDDNLNEVPDIIEEYIDTQWGSVDFDENGTTTAEEYEQVIGSYDEDDDVDIEDYKLFFTWNVEYWLSDEFWEEYGTNHSNVVEVTVADDGSITIIDEGAMEFQMMPSGVYGGQPYDDFDSEYFEILDTERIRAFWIPNYWIANDGLMGEYGANHHFMTQYRGFGDVFAPGITDNANWKIRFNNDGTVVLVSTWTDLEDDTATLQLVKYTDEYGNECVTMVGCYGERWQYSELLTNCTVISGAYLYASEPAYVEPPHECFWGEWEDDDVTDTHTRKCTFEGCTKKQTENHNWDGGVQTEAPTCTESGTILYTCPDCEATKTDSVPALEHDWGEWTYDSVDSHIRYCQRENCDAEDYDGHDWEEWKPVDDTTHELTCSICKGSQTEGHDFDDGVVTKEPTCEDTGIMTFTCGTCKLTKTKDIAATGHEFSDWTPNNDGTTHSRYCICNETQTAPHSFDDGVETLAATHTSTGIMTFTCTDGCGYSYDTEIPTTPEHTWAEWVPNDDETHTRRCICTETETEGCKWDDGVVTDEPTHLELGTKTYTCTLCGNTKTEELERDAKHTWGEWTVGKTDVETLHVRFCDCGESETAPHSFDDGVETLAATHTSTGIMTFTCTDGCGYSYDTEIPTTPEHTWAEWVPNDDETHTRRCICTETETEGCKWDDGVVTDEPTHLELGTKTYTCTLCGNTKTEELERDAKHTWGKWTVGKTDVETLHVRFCDCGESETAPHSFDNGVETLAATHTSTGIMTFTCTDGCGYSYDTEIPTTPEHTWGDWSGNNDGRTHSRECKCGESETAEHNWSEWEEQAAGGFERVCADCSASEIITLDEEKPVNTTTNDNDANTNLTNSDFELIDKVLTNEEQSEVAEGAEVKVYLKVEDISNEAPLAHVAEAEAAAGNDEIGMYLDIDLFKQVGTATETPVSETDGAVTITITIPDNLINTNASITRTYKIIRVHEDENGNLITDVIEGVFNPEDNTFTFETNKFSTYALAYSDKSNDIHMQVDFLVRDKLGYSFYAYGEGLSQFDRLEIVVNYSYYDYDAVNKVNYVLSSKTVVYEYAVGTVIEYDEIAAYEMMLGTTFTLNCYKGEEVAVTKSGTITYASLVYATMQAAEDKTVYMDMLNYGAAAQDYFANNNPGTDIAKNTAKNGLPTDLAGIDAYQQYATSDEVASAALATNEANSSEERGARVGSALQILSSNRLVFVVDPGNYEATDLQLEVRYGENVSTISVDTLERAGSYYYYYPSEEEALALYDVNVVVSAYLYRGDEAVAVKTYSIEAFVAESMMDGGKLEALGDALMKFADSAKHVIFGE